MSVYFVAVAHIMQQNSSVAVFAMYFEKTAIICTFLQRTIVETKVLHAILCDDPRACPIKFFAYFRIYIDSFDELLLSIKPLLTHICVYKNTTFRLVIPPEKSSSSGVIRIHIEMLFERQSYR